MCSESADPIDNKDGSFVWDPPDPPHAKSSLLFNKQEQVLFTPHSKTYHLTILDTHLISITF
jgi:hypothetical protein